MENWRMSNQGSLSDYSWMFFSLIIAVEATNLFSYSRRIYWRNFNQVVKNKFWGARFGNIDTT